MLDHYRGEFGVELAEDAIGIAAAPFVDLPVALPQFEEQLDLPAGAGQDHRLSNREHGRRGVGDQEGPAGQRQFDGLGRSPSRFASARIFARRVSATRRGTRTASNRAATWAVTPNRTAIESRLRGCRQPGGQSTRSPSGRRRASADAAATGSTRPARRSLRHRQTPKPEIGHPQRPRRQREVLHGTAFVLGRGPRWAAPTAPGRPDRGHREFEGGLTALGHPPAAARPDGGQPSGKRSWCCPSTHRREPRQDPGRHRIRHDHLPQRRLPDLAQQRRRGRSEALAEPLRASWTPLSAALGQLLQGRLRVPAPPQDRRLDKTARSVCCAVGSTRSRATSPGTSMRTCCSARAPVGNWPSGDLLGGRRQHPPS